MVAQLRRVDLSFIVHNDESQSRSSTQCCHGYLPK